MRMVNIRDARNPMAVCNRMVILTALRLLQKTQHISRGDSGLLGCEEDT